MNPIITKNCPITGEASQFYCQKQNADYFINQKNGVIFLGTMPPVCSMMEYANEHYEKGVYQDYLKAKDLKILTATIRLKQIAKYQPGRKVLDIGCSAGFFLETAEQHGYDIQGIEFSSVAIQSAASHIRDKLIQGDVHQELGRWQNNVDWVSAFDLIEHMHNPVQFISNVKKILKDGGLLVMSTPDTGHFLRRLMGSRWPMLQPLQHTVLFSRKAMKEMLVREGFSNIKIETTYKYLTFDYLAQQLRETNKIIGTLMRWMLKIIPKKIAKYPFRVNIGEFIVFANKTH